MTWRTRIAVWILAIGFAALTIELAFKRYATFHNHTFDLALYAREAWGISRGQYWDPIVGVHFLGLHVAWVLFPLGYLGQAFGTVPVLLCAQAIAFALTAIPLAELGARRFGELGGLCGAAAFLLYPNPSHVATYEFHPGSLALLPLAFALDAIDHSARDAHATPNASEAHDAHRLPTAVTLTLACLGILACRADFALLVILLGAVASWLAPKLRRTGYAMSALGVVYLLVQTLVLRKLFWPKQGGSLDLHFAIWGGSPFGIVAALFTQPSLVWHHLTASGRLSYLPRVLWPLALLPLLAPRWLVLTLPFIAINLISTFPTTTELYSHYLTPVVPVLVVAMLDGVDQLRRWSSRPQLHVVALLVVLAASLLGQRLLGGMRWSNDFEAAAFVHDDYSAQAQRVVASIPPAASVQAPDPMLAHLAERPLLYRAPPPDQDADFVVLDIDHRRRYAGQETLLRTTEEPVTRAWLARRDYGLVRAEARFLVLQRGVDPRSGIASRYFTGFPGMRSAIELTDCLWVLSAWLAPGGLELELVSQAPCPSDLALRIGWTDRPEHVDLLFDGLFSPAQLHDEFVTSWHVLSAKERADIVEHGLRLGVLRANGEPPDRNDPTSRPVPLIH